MAQIQTGRLFMIRKSALLAMTAAFVSFSLSAFAQEEGLSKNEVTVQAFGSFLKSTNNNGVEQTATNSGGVLGSYRFFFNDHNGVEVNYGYSLNTQNYRFLDSATGVPSYSHEVTAAYVFRFPLRRWTPFVLAGTGALLFDPKDTQGASTQARAAFVYGGGADFTLTHHIYVRAEYRGLVYNSPTFDFETLAGTARITHRAEPSIGFGYRF
jgi:opacity protein-like surface antigen